jgi:hypothetical protein
MISSIIRLSRHIKRDRIEIHLLASFYSHTHATKAPHKIEVDRSLDVAVAKERKDGGFSVALVKSRDEHRLNEDQVVRIYFMMMVLTYSIDTTKPACEHDLVSSRPIFSNDTKNKTTRDRVNDRQPY